MRRRDFITIVSAAAATGLFPARAQAARVRRIGVLMGLDANDPEGQSEVRALKQALQELGWIEGGNLQIEDHWPGAEPDRIRASAKELVGLGCEVIVARSNPVTAALVKETRAIPIKGRGPGQSCGTADSGREASQICTASRAKSDGRHDCHAARDLWPDLADQDVCRSAGGRRLYQ